MVKDKIKLIEEHLGLLKTDADKFEAGNGSAGTRVRKVSMEIIKLSKEIRSTVSEVKKQRETEKAEK